MTVRNRLTSLPRLWFSFRMPVHRLEYAASGLVLTPFKFLIDSWLYGQDSGGSDDALVSHRGEFRIVPLPDGKTRLEGSTWYTLDMSPQLYWTLWSDAVIHRIHSRVLRHVKELSERDRGVGD